MCHYITQVTSFATICYTFDFKETYSFFKINYCIYNYLGINKQYLTYAKTGKFLNSWENMFIY